MDTACHVHIQTNFATKEIEKTFILGLFECWMTGQCRAVLENFHRTLACAPQYFPPNNISRPFISMTRGTKTALVDIFVLGDWYASYIYIDIDIYAPSHVLERKEVKFSPIKKGLYNPVYKMEKVQKHSPYNSYQIIAGTFLSNKLI